MAPHHLQLREIQQYPFQVGNGSPEVAGPQGARVAHLTLQGAKRTKIIHIQKHYAVLLSEKWFIIMGKKCKAATHEELPLALMG